MIILLEIAKAACLGLVRYASMAMILLVTLTLICESTAQGLTLAVALLAYMLSTWGLRQTYDVTDVDDYTGGFSDER